MINKMKHPKTFNGPLFVIGMPRSGTKLIRCLLSNHPKIGITDETEFLPYYIGNWNKFGDVQDKDNFHRLYKSILNTTYIMTKSRYGTVIPEQTWYEMCESYDLQGVMEAFIRYYTGGVNDQDFVWGDKSPSYTRYMAEFKKAFPEAKFIHIVRDVRDCCLSAYKARRKNMIRFAQRWNNNLASINKEISNLPEGDYLEIRYEDLLENPEKTLRKCTDFIGVDFMHELTTLEKPAENIHGDAKGITTIKKDNVGKYKHKMDEKTKLSIEQITVGMLKKYEYDYTYDGQEIRTSELMMRYYQVADLINRFVYDVKREGLIWAIKRPVVHYQKSRIRG